MPSDIFLKVAIQQQNKMILLNLIENALLEDSVIWHLTFLLSIRLTILTSLFFS